MERGAVADVDGDRDPLANLGHVGVGQHLALDAGEAPPGFAEFIVERRRLAIAGDRRFDLARGAETMPERNQVRGLVGFDLCQTLLDRARFVRPSALADDMGGNGTQFGIADLDYKILEYSYCLFKTPPFAKDRRKHAQGSPTATALRK